MLKNLTRQISIFSNRSHGTSNSMEQGEVLIEIESSGLVTKSAHQYGLLNADYN